MLLNLDVTLDCKDVDAQADFWAEALGYRRHGAEAQYRSLMPPEHETTDGRGLPKMVLQHVDDPAKTAKNKLHLDLIVGDRVEAEATRLEALGATRLSEEIYEAETVWIVMADPEGNEFCICVR